MRLWFRTNDSDLSTTIKANKRQILVVVLKWVLTATIFGIITFFSIFGIDFNARIYPKGILAYERPDSGNISYTCRNTLNSIQAEHYGIIPSVPVKEDDVCFDYVSLIQQTVDSNTTFHTFWSTQLSKRLTENQIASLRSFDATQSTSSKLFVWISNTDKANFLEKDSLWHTIKSNRIEYKVIEEDIDTPLGISDNSVKLASLYKYGGVWFDLDVLFVRDMSPLLHQQWLTQASCFERSQFASKTTVDSRFSGGLMHFYAQSPYLCELISAASEEKQLGPQLYARVYYRLVRHRISPWAVLPWCFTEPTQCKKSNSLPSLFDNSRNFDKERLSQVFTMRYYKKWNSSQGSVFKYLDNLHKQSTRW